MGKVAVSEPAQDQRRQHATDLADNAGLIELALKAQLDGWTIRHGNRGQQEYVQRTGLSDSTISDKIKEHPADAARECEELGIVPFGTVSRLAVRLDQYQGQRLILRVSGAAWEPLRDLCAIDGVTAPAFRAPTEAVLAAEAFIAAHREAFVAGQPLNEDNTQIASHLASELCRIASGPTLLDSECLDVLALLAPKVPGVLLDHIDSHPFGTKVVRSLDRAVRRERTNRPFRTSVHQLLRSPGGPNRNRLLPRRRYWMRGLRRVVLFDQQNAAATAERSWALGQLRRAMRGEASYEWLTEDDRVYAFWVLVELTRNESSWRDIEAIAAEQPGLAQHIPAARRARDWHANHSHLELFCHTPRSGWEPPTEAVAVIECHLETTRPRVFHGLRPAVRRGAMHLLRDALLTPCDIQKRTACDTLIASGQAVTEAAASVVASLVADIEPTPLTTALLERCMHLLSRLPGSSSVPALRTVLQPSQQWPISVVREAMWGAGTAALHNPLEAPTLLGVVMQAVDRLDDPATTTLATHTMVALGRSPADLNSDRVAAAGLAGGMDIVSWA